MTLCVCSMVLGVAVIVVVGLLLRACTMYPCTPFTCFFLTFLQLFLPYPFLTLSYASVLYTFFHVHVCTHTTLLHGFRMVDVKQEPLICTQNIQKIPTLTPNLTGMETLRELGGKVEYSDLLQDPKACQLHLLFNRISLGEYTSTCTCTCACM